MKLTTYLASAFLCLSVMAESPAQTIQNDKNMEELNLTQEWDKTFPQSDEVRHSKVTFHNRYGITLAADLYIPKNATGKLPAIAISGPFGAVKEQASGLYAQELARRDFLTIAFDPSFTGESGGQPRYVASPDINTEDFCAAVDYLSTRDDVDPERIGILGICGWGGMAVNARNGTYELAGGLPDVVPDDAPQYVKDYFAYYKTERGYHRRSLNSNGGWNKTSTLSFLNMPILSYAGEIRSAVLLVHGEKAHSRYFSEDTYKKLTGGNKELLIVPGANHTDLYDNFDKIPFDWIEQFFRDNLK